MNEKFLPLEAKSELHALRSEVAMLRERLAAMEAFKNYVHTRLDEQGVPHDPAPFQTTKHGCRIEGRLEYVFGKLATATETVSCIATLYGYKPEELLTRLTELTEIRESMPDWQPGDRPKLEIPR